MNPVVVPYDPPVKSRRDSIRRDSFLHEVEDGFERVATVADKVEHYAHEVEKGAQFGRHLVQELDDEYGAELQRRPSSRKAPAGPPGYDDHDRKQTLPSTSTSASAPRGVQDPKHLLGEIEATQNEVDGLMHDLERIAELRHQLTGAAYATTELRGNQKRGPPASRKAEEKLVKDIAASASQATAGLLAVYDRVVSLPPQVDATARAVRDSNQIHRVQKALTQINSSFANVLDFVEDRAEEEKQDIADGKSDARLRALMEEEHPTWYRSKTLMQLRDARAASKGQTFEKADPISYTFRWMVEHPFMQLDKAAVSAIDMAEHRNKSAQEPKTGSRKVGDPKAQKGMASGNGSGFARWSKKQCNVLAVGKSHRARSALSEGKDAPWTTLSGSEDEFSDLEKQKRKLLKGSAWAVDVSKLPERVPTDDTSGYQESQAELIADAIDESKTEHLLTPFVSLFWVGIVILYGYYLIARMLGFEDPLGHVDLGETFGNDHWNDTDAADGMSATLSASAATKTVASLYSLASALHSAASALPVRR
ncbi:hypothetical protein B0A53_02993 [Rhodotorula sp. CCFEE 5036]|nr:hypothetical protein B0A53_02993 [Rhodotorula sp. CCFEE 5036]